MVQIIIIVLYFALTVAIGMWSSKKSKTSDSFHGAEMGLFAIVCASAGEWLGGTATTGVSEYGFVYGLSGSGTTGYVAQKHNRKYIGIDIKQEYLDISINRLGLNKEGCLF